MNIFHYLYQPDKSALSPFARALVAWLEIVIITIIGAAVAAALDYLNGHPNDFSGALPFIESAVVIAFLKSFTTLGFSLKNLSGTPPTPTITTVPPVAPPTPTPVPVEPTPLILSSPQPQERPVFQPQVRLQEQQEEQRKEDTPPLA